MILTMQEADTWKYEITIVDNIKTVVASEDLLTIAVEQIFFVDLTIYKYSICDWTKFRVLFKEWTCICPCLEQSLARNKSMD